MHSFVIDPETNPRDSAYEIYNVPGSLFTIPFNISDNLTFAKPRDEREKYFKKFQLMSLQYSKLTDEKSPSMLNLEVPVGWTRMTETPLNRSGSQHMSTILDGTEEAGFSVKGIDMIVASDTLHKIAGTILKPAGSWKLRAYSECFQQRNIIILCDDDMEEAENGEFRCVENLRPEFANERLESTRFAQAFCHSGVGEKDLRVGKAVLSTLTFKDSRINLMVLGEVDMANEQQTVNAAVMTGRTNRVNLGQNEDAITHSFEYIWSRCFWIGMKNCVVGMRSEYDQPVKTIHWFDLKEYYQSNRKRFDYYPDTATSCVAQVLNRLKEAMKTSPTENWIIEYKGRDNDFEQRNIRISAASDTRSFWAISEYFRMIKEEKISRKEKDLPSQNKETSKVRVFPQRTRHGITKIDTSFIQKLMKILNS